ncbi:GNAT family N-acetyltransferase [Thalassotalea sp. PS06]|uniref:GNAT family N-acetyltransferase n=1 Tax=Thalassotalea sp. PS06 TaxID=2594005 RepID=UPI001C8F54B6|nr:GNAT family N-acetyltransferase [Thalassotalea sp. PS06]
MVSSITIRNAGIEDSGLILRYITELARYEKAEHEVKACEETIKASLFGPGSVTRALICEYNNEPVGFAVYFFNYSTWLAKQGLYLEDLYITPVYRGHGAGKALLRQLARIALDNNCGRFEWSVLDWNKPAIDFYQSIGAEPQSEWVGYRLTGQALLDLAQ